MDDELLSWKSPASRAVGIFVGLATQFGFLITVSYLFVFLRSGVPADDSPWLLTDLLLSVQFAVVHSLVLHPGVKRHITRFIPAAFYGCLFCVTTCLCLAMIFIGWHGSRQAIWDLSGPPAAIVRCGFYASWTALFYSLYISGLGHQTGLTPWWYWLRRQPQPRRKFAARGAYRWLRHPIYLSFLGLIWWTPRMTWDHAVLTVVWTIYVFVGSYLKDERLAYYLGDEYRQYQAQVVGYPFVFWGPLARRPVASATRTVNSGGDSLPRAGTLVERAS
jgi:protein-S-isoprenylcysteine O-methyltransferase Ste14